MIRTISFLILFVVFPTVSFASPCSSSQRDKAYYYAEIAGGKIVDGYGGGNNVNTRLVECDYNTYSNEFRLRVDITWNGAIDQSNFYNSEGTLKLNSSGQNTNYSETYANSLLQDWKSTMAFWGTVFELGALAAENSGSSIEGYRVRITSQCIKDVDVAIRYKNTSGEWVFAKWYSIESGEKTYLNHGSSQMRTNSAVIYHFAETKSGVPWDVGGHNFSSGGRDFPMQKTVDKEGVTDIILCD